jgi:hypothetical protein
MARPIKRMRAERDVVKELRRRSRATTIGVRDRERAEIILRRLDGVGVEAVAAQLMVQPDIAARAAYSRPCPTGGFDIRSVALLFRKPAHLECRAGSSRSFGPRTRSHCWSWAQERMYYKSAYWEVLHGIFST